MSNNEDEELAMSEKDLVLSDRVKLALTHWAESEYLDVVVPLARGQVIERDLPELQDGWFYGLMAGIGVSERDGQTEVADFQLVEYNPTTLQKRIVKNGLDIKDAMARKHDLELGSAPVGLGR